MRLFIALVSFLFVSCNGQKKAAMEDAKQTKSNDSLELLASDNQIGFDEAEILVIKDQKRLKNFYSKVNMTRKPGLPIPDIDFTKEMIVIQCGGKQESSELLPLLIFEETDSEVVLGTKIPTKLDTKSTEMQSNRFRVYKMPLTQKEVRFDEGVE